MERSRSVVSHGKCWIGEMEAALPRCLGRYPVQPGMSTGWKTSKICRTATWILWAMKVACLGLEVPAQAWAAWSPLLPTTWGRSSPDDNELHDFSHRCTQTCSIHPDSFQLELFNCIALFIISILRFFSFSVLFLNDIFAVLSPIN